MAVCEMLVAARRLMSKYVAERDIVAGEGEPLNVAGQQHAEAIGDDLAKRCGRGDDIYGSGGSKARCAARGGDARSQARRKPFRPWLPPPLK